MAHVGWIGSFYALALLNLLLGGGLIWRFSPRACVTSQRAKPGFSQTFALARRTPLLGLDPAGRNRHAQLSAGSSAWLPARLRDEHHFSLQATGLAGGCPLLLSLGSKFLGGVILDKMRPEQAPLLVYYRRPTHRRFCAGADAQPAAGDAGAVYAGGERFLGITGAAIPAVVQHHAPREAGSAWDH